jgi:hypothetical protein
VVLLTCRDKYHHLGSVALKFSDMKQGVMLLAATVLLVSMCAKQRLPKQAFRFLMAVHIANIT